MVDALKTLLNLHLFVMQWLSEDHQSQISLAFNKYSHAFPIYWQILSLCLTFIEHKHCCADHFTYPQVISHATAATGIPWTWYTKMVIKFVRDLVKSCTFMVMANKPI
jgi:hypothetical protein